MKWQSFVWTNFVRGFLFEITVGILVVIVAIPLVLLGLATSGTTGLTIGVILAFVFGIFVKGWVASLVIENKFYRGIERSLGG